MTFKEVGPACTRAVQAQPACTCRQKIIFACAHVTIAKTTRVHSQIRGKNEKARVNSPNFGILMDVCSLEREGA
jgi:hypothetical protein